MMKDRVSCFVLRISCVAVVVTFAGSALAGVWYVAPTGDDGNAGSAEKPFATINHAIASAAEGDEIRIQAGTYVENVRNVAAENGKNGLQFRGGYAADWTRDLKTQKTVIKAANAAQAVFFTDTKSNVFNGIVLTGGLYGFNSSNGTTANRHVVYQCVSSNNTYGIFSQAGTVVVSSLVVGNSNYGIRCGQQYSKTFVYNCTVADNADAALYQQSEYSGTIEVRNSVLLRNKHSFYHLWTYNDEVNVYNCAMFGETAGRDEGKGNASVIGNGATNPGAVTRIRNSIALDPRLADDYTLADASPCLKRGQDLSENENFAVLEDLEGRPWGGQYDLGCFKSDSPAPVLALLRDVYVSKEGNDDTNGGTSFGDALASVGAALRKVAEYGSVHIMDGTYVEDTAYVLTKGVRLIGESRDGTVLKFNRAYAANTSGAACYLAVEDAVISNMTLSGGAACLMFGPRPTCTNCLAVACVFTNGFWGVYAQSGTKTEMNRLSHCISHFNNASGLHAHAPMSADNCLFVSNKFAGVCTEILNMQGPAGYYIHCSFVGNRDSGFNQRYDSTSQDYIWNCAFVENGAYAVSRKTARWYHHPVKLFRCCYFGNASGTILSSNDGVTEETFNFDPFTSDPKLIKAGHDIYVPDLGSSLVKAGKMYNEFTDRSVPDDLDGFARPPKRPDVGCYQHRYVKGLNLLIR